MEAGTHCWRMGKELPWEASRTLLLQGGLSRHTDTKQGQNNSALTQKFSMLPSKIQFYIISNKSILFLEGNGYAPSKKCLQQL